MIFWGQVEAHWLVTITTWQKSWPLRRLQRWTTEVTTNTYLRGAPKFAYTAEIRFLAVRSHWFRSRHCTNWRFKPVVLIARIHVRWTSKLSQETQYLASILSNTFVKCICPNISCALRKWSLHSRWNFISTFTELHVHGDERSLTEVTSHTYFHGVEFAYSRQAITGKATSASYTWRYCESSQWVYNACPCLFRSKMGSFTSMASDVMGARAWCRTRFLFGETTPHESCTSDVSPLVGPVRAWNGLKTSFLVKNVAAPGVLARPSGRLGICMHIFW